MKFLKTDATLIGLAVASILLVGLASPTPAAERRQEEAGIAATYSDKSGKTTSGEAFNPENMTAAHR
jgi:rare lipoprotein A (peptidoglycan hydrolase)